MPSLKDIVSLLQILSWSKGQGKSEGFQVFSTYIIASFHFITYNECRNRMMDSQMSTTSASQSMAKIKVYNPVDRMEMTYVIVNLIFLVI